MAGPPSTGFNFNTMTEIRSHSSYLYNERVAILFYLLDMKSIRMNTNYQVSDMLEVKSTLQQIYKNIRTLIRNTPTMRATLNLETKDEGIYVTDVAMGVIEQMIQYCESTTYTTRKLYIIIQKLNEVEMILKDVLQYFHYFIRPDFRQKPDVELATETYKEIADKRTIEELRQLVGKNHKIDFDSLGSSRVDLIEEVPYDENVDGEIDKEEEEEEEPKL